MSAELVVNLVGFAADIISSISKRLDDEEVQKIIAEQKIQELLVQIHQTSFCLIEKIKKNDQEVDKELGKK